MNTACESYGNLRILETETLVRLLVLQNNPNTASLDRPPIDKLIDELCNRFIP